MEESEINEPDALDCLKKEAKDGSFITVVEMKISITLDLEKRVFLNIEIVINNQSVELKIDEFKN